MSSTTSPIPDPSTPLTPTPTTLPRWLSRLLSFPPETDPYLIGKLSLFNCLAVTEHLIKELLRSSVQPGVDDETIHRVQVASVIDHCRILAVLYCRQHCGKPRLANAARSFDHLLSLALWMNSHAWRQRRQPAYLEPLNFISRVWDIFALALADEHMNLDALVDRVASTSNYTDLNYLLTRETTGRDSIFAQPATAHEGAYPMLHRLAKYHRAQAEWANPFEEYFERMREQRRVFAQHGQVPIDPRPIPCSADDFFGNYLAAAKWNGITAAENAPPSNLAPPTTSAAPQPTPSVPSSSPSQDDDDGHPIAGPSTLPTPKSSMQRIPPPLQGPLTQAQALVQENACLKAQLRSSDAKLAALTAELDARQRARIEALVRARLAKLELEAAAGVEVGVARRKKGGKKRGRGGGHEVDAAGGALSREKRRRPLLLNLNAI